MFPPIRYQLSIDTWSEGPETCSLNSSSLAHLDPILCSPTFNAPPAYYNSLDWAPLFSKLDEADGNCCTTIDGDFSQLTGVPTGVLKTENSWNTTEIKTEEWNTPQLPTYIKEEEKKELPLESRYILSNTTNTDCNATFQQQYSDDMNLMPSSQLWNDHTEHSYDYNNNVTFTGTHKLGEYGDPRIGDPRIIGSIGNDNYGQSSDPTDYSIMDNDDLIKEDIQLTKEDCDSRSDFNDSDFGSFTPFHQFNDSNGQISQEGLKSSKRFSRSLIRPTLITVETLLRIMPNVIHQFPSISRIGLCRQLKGKLYTNSPQPSPNFIINTLIPVYLAAGNLGFPWHMYLMNSLAFVKSWIFNHPPGKELLNRIRIDYHAPTSALVGLNERIDRDDYYSFCMNRENTTDNYLHS